MEPSRRGIGDSTAAGGALVTMDPMPRLTLPPLPRNPLAVLSKDELRARVATLELANWRAEVRADLLAEELKAARAHSRLLALKLAAKT